jgi:hypothetical protein
VTRQNAEAVANRIRANRYMEVSSLEMDGVGEVFAAAAMLALRG